MARRKFLWGYITPYKPVNDWAKTISPRFADMQLESGIDLLMEVVRIKRGLYDFDLVWGDKEETIVRDFVYFASNDPDDRLPMSDMSDDTKEKARKVQEILNLPHPPAWFIAVIGPPP